MTNVQQSQFWYNPQAKMYIGGYLGVEQKQLLIKNSRIIKSPQSCESKVCLNTEEISAHRLFLLWASEEQRRSCEFIHIYYTTR